MNAVRPETWKDVSGYEGLYKVSNLGRIKSLYGWNGHRYVKRKRIINGWEQKPVKDKPYSRMKTSLIKNGNKKGFMVHRIVAEAFIPNPENKPYINHIDGNPLNNISINLEWCTQKENVRHAIETGLNVRPWDLVKRKHLIDMLNAGWSYQDIADHYEVGKGTVFNYTKRFNVKTKYY